MRKEVLDMIPEWMKEHPLKAEPLWIPFCIALISAVEMPQSGDAVRDDLLATLLSMFVAGTIFQKIVMAPEELKEEMLRSIQKEFRTNRDLN